MRELITILIIAIFVAVSIIIGIYSRKGSNTVGGFVLGGRAVGPWLTAFAFGTAYFSAVVFVGYAGKFGWSYGLSAIWIGLGNAFIGSLLAWVVMGRRTRIITKHLDSATMPEFFEKRYLSKPLKIISAIIVFIFLIPYTASVYNGLSRVFAEIFNLPYEAFVVGIGVITAIYVIIGGYKATALNDFFQGFLMIGGIAAVVYVALNKHGGFYSSISKLSEFSGGTGPLGSNSGVFTSMLGPDPMSLIGVIILTSLGTWGLPQMVHKFYTIKDDQSIKIGTIISTIFAIIISGGCYLLGGFGRVFRNNVPPTTPSGGLDSDAIIPELIGSFPTILTGLIVVLILSASMSTLSSLVLTSSSTLTLDLINPFFKGKLSEKKKLFIMRILIAVFIMLSIIIALNKNTLISDLMGYSWGALAGAFLAPFLYGLYSKKITRLSVYVSFASAVFLTTAHFIMSQSGYFAENKLVVLGFNLASPINLGALIMIGNLVLVPIVSLITPKLNKDQINEVFSCYEATNKGQ